MNISYLSSARNTTFSSKPTSAIGLFLMVLLILSTNISNSQTISAVTYPSIATTGVSLTTYTSSGTLLGIGKDDDNSVIANIGFDFWFNGTRYTQFGVSANGYMSLGSAPTANGASTYANDLANGADVPKIAPFWDDLTTGSDGYVKYGLNGTAPYTTLVVEWKTNLWSGGYSGFSAGMIFQAILSETTGKIQFMYGPGMATSTGYSIGFGTSTSNLLSMKVAINVATYGSDTNNLQTTSIASGKSYSITPLVPTTPTTLNFTSVTTSSMSLNWTDNATNEVGYVIYTSTDNFNYTFQQQKASNSTTANISGLTSGVTYYYKIFAITEGCLSSAVAGSAVATNATVITLSKSDETCSSNNDGTVNSTLSGGLSNIRYIKLTQKYNSWQQVAEIQAFQILTGINVASVSNGTTASSSTNYLNDTTNFGPQKAIDWDINGGSFWHSNSKNVNEWIKVDLQSGKNIDYLRIFNRSSCCSDRGQNMLLELFDSSNNVVYSKAVNLYGGFTGEHYIDVNVLDLAWADGATTINRTGLDSGTYTLNLNDANGYSSSKFVALAATTTTPSAPSIGIITQPTCVTSKGSFTITNYNTTFTYTVTPSLGVTITSSSVTAPAGIYTIKATSVSCSSADTNFTINAQPATPIITTQPVTAPICENTSGSFTVATSAPSPTYQWQYASSIAGTYNNTNTIANVTGHTTDTLTLTNAPVAYSGNYVRCVVTSGGCSVYSNAVLLTVLPNKPASVSIVASPTGPICSGTNVTFTANPTNGGTTPTYQWKVGGSNVGTNSPTYSTPTLDDGNSVTCVMISNATPCLTGSVATSNAVVISSPTKTWDGSKWTIAPSSTPVAVPSANDAIIFNGNYTSIGDLSSCSCLVNSGVSVIFNSGNTLKVTNAVTVNSTGSLFISDKASLVQINNINANAGNISYERVANYARNTDYVYWSSPVSGTQTIGGFSPYTLSGKYYSFDSLIEDWKQEYTTTIMTGGKGYIIRGEEPHGALPPSSYLFIGKPNNGHYEIPIIKKDASYLIGNPYPSALDADAFLLQNKDVLYGTLYFWTHNTQIGQGTSNNGPEAFPYTQNDYATYNSTGGVGITPDPDPSNLGTSAALSGGTKPSGSIAAAQGFFASSKLTSEITATAPYKIVFNNNMRFGVGGIKVDNTQFFKTKNPTAKTTNTIEKDRVWLNLTNTQGAFKQTLIGYVTGATNENDSAFDGESFDGQEFVDFYSVNQEKNLTIQGRALPFDENDEVPLGFRSTIEGSFTINIDEVDGSMTNQDVFLEDKLTNTTTSLKTENYTFNTVAGTFNDRFVLKYKPSDKTLGNADFDAKSNRVLVSVKNKQIKINSFSETIINVTIFDLLGRQIYKKDKLDSNEFLTTDFSASQQSLIVKTTLQNGTIETTKIIF